METTSPKVLTGIRIVFFDLDDTLCGYWEASKKALDFTFEQHTIPGHTPQEMVDTWAAAFRDFVPTLKDTGWYASYLRKGESTRTEQMRLMLKRLDIEDEALAVALSATYADKRNEFLELFPEALEVLGTFSSLFRMGLITNGPADVQRSEIEKLGIGHFFEHVYIEGEMGRGKPLPAVFEQIANEVECKPEEILFIGNSYFHDVRPGIEAGWHTAWIRKATDVAPSSTHAHLEALPEGAPEPDLIIGDLRELYGLLGIS